MGKGIRSLALCLALLATACSAKTVQNETLEESDSHTFNAPYERLVNASRIGLLGMRLIIQSEADEPGGHVIMFTRRASINQWGGVGRLVVDAEAPHTVHFNYDKRFISWGAGQERYARNVFKKMDEALK